MLFTKSRGNRSNGSEEEDFEGLLPYMGIAASLIMCPPTCQLFQFPLTFKLT